MKSQYKRHNTQRGFSLVELMIAMTIGITLIGGAFYVFSHTRAAFSANEKISLMQENARFAFAIMEPDIQLAGFWGNHNESAFIIGDADDRGLTNPIDVADACGPNWVLEFDQPVEGFNDILPDWACIDATRFQSRTDAIALRRVDSEPEPVPQAGHIYMRSSEAPLSQVFEGNDEPTNLPPNAQNFEVAARGYYISSYTIDPQEGGSWIGAELPPIPSLRRIELATPAGGSAEMMDREIVSGVENMQIQYGVDLTANEDGRKTVNAYVTADNPILLDPATIIRSVRIWLLMRAERPELGYVDDQSYQLGDVLVAPASDSFRRMVASKTIFLRNRHE